MINEKKGSEYIIEKMANNEELIGKLYNGFAEVFPDHSGYWKKLEAAEKQHADWLRNLSDTAESTAMFIDERRFNVIAVQNFMKSIEKELARLKEQPITLTEALAITYYIEQSLIESKYLEVFKTDSNKLKVVLKRLNEDTLAHRNLAKEELEKFKKN